MTINPLIQGVGLGKVFGEFTALADANFTVASGEVRALMGSNGAGKSTLIKILTGAIAPSTGHVLVAGERVKLGSPTEMIRKRVACIYQHSNLAPAMTVLDNIYLGRHPTKTWGAVDTAKMRLEASALLEKYGLNLDLDDRVSRLPPVKQKEVEIAKALALDANVLLMDEPTAWLSSVEVDKLHATIRRLKDMGVAIVYISHILDEIFAVCDTITIMRDGRVVHSGNMIDITRSLVVHTMVGEKLARQAETAAGKEMRHKGTGRVLLECDNLGKKSVFRDVSFKVHEGEIFCVTGLIGSKRTELMHCIFGSDQFDTGRLVIDGAERKFTSPAGAMKAGLGFVTEDRHREGLMLGLSVADNLVMSTIGRFTKWHWLDRAGIMKAARRLIQALSIKLDRPQKEVRLLSGGNQQKVVLAKWIDRKPKILILDEPSVGVDIGAKGEIYAHLRSERDRGAAILIVSSDLEEVVTIADTIAVMNAGRLVAIHDAASVTMADLVSEIGEGDA